MSSVRLSVCPSVTLEILETNGHSATSSQFVAQRAPPPRRTWGNFGETKGGVGKSGVLEHNKATESETRKDR